MSQKRSHKSYPVSLGVITHRITSSLCREHKHFRHARIFVDWRLIFDDEVGLLYKPIKLSYGKLTVQTSSAQASLLAYFAPSMIERINRYLGYEVVTSILANHGYQKLDPKLNQKMPARELDDVTQSSINAITNNDLRQAMIGWAQSVI